MKTIRKAHRASPAAAANLSLAFAVASARMPDDASPPTDGVPLGAGSTFAAPTSLLRWDSGEARTPAGPLGCLPLPETVAMAALAEFDDVSS